MDYDGPDVDDADVREAMQQNNVLKRLSPLPCEHNTEKCSMPAAACDASHETENRADVNPRTETHVDAIADEEYDYDATIIGESDVPGFAALGISSAT